MNSDSTIAARMEKAGLPYECTNMENPQFILSGGSSVVAIWRDSVNDNTRSFVGYLSGAEAEVAAQSARRVRGVYVAYVVTSERID